MSGELQLLILRFEDEKATHRRREAYLTSLVLHLLLVIFILVSPKLFSNNNEKLLSRRNLTALDESKQLGLLALDKDYQKLLQKPKSPLHSDKVRISQGKPPAVDPKELQAPHPVKKAQVPEQSSPPSTPKPASPTLALPPPPTSSSAAGGQRPSQPGETETEGKQVAQLQSPQPPGPSAGTASRSLREISESLESPGFSVQSAIEKARQSGSYGQGGQSGNSIHNFDRRNPDFSVEQPAIISDTQGVDFSPWLHLIYYRVRDNWYSVVPELIRTRTKGKVVLIFDIRNNGRIDNMEVLRSSGLSPYDRAAVSSIKLSEPFPSFPPAFKGELITVQFTYLYNIRTQ